LQDVEPSFAVQISGFLEPPDAGDQFEVCEDMKAARDIAQQRERASGAAASSSANAYAQSAGDSEQIRLSIILKTDAQGSVAAVKYMFNDVKDSKYLNLRWIMSAPGQITETDVELAATCPKDQRAMIIGFNTDALPGAVRMAKEKGVEIRTFEVIYKLFETVIAVLENSLGAEERLDERGTAEVLAVFGGRDGNVAGCRITAGVLSVDNVVKVYRNGKEIMSAPILSLRQGKNAVKDVEEGNECGFCLKGWDQWESGDKVTCFQKNSVRPEILAKK